MLQIEANRSKNVEQTKQQQTKQQQTKQKQTNQDVTFDTSKQEATHYAVPNLRILGLRLGSFWVLLAPMPVWTCRKCCWLLLTVLCVSVYLMFILCVSKEMRPMKLFSLGFRVVAHVPCYLSKAVILLFSALSLFYLIFIVTFPPGVIQINFIALLLLIISGAAFRIIGLTKISKIEFLPLDWIYRSIRNLTVFSVIIC